MNAGTDYTKAMKKAKLNANFSCEPRFVHCWNGIWWISKRQPRTEEFDMVLPDTETLIDRQVAERSEL